MPEAALLPGTIPWPANAPSRVRDEAATLRSGLIRGHRETRSIAPGSAGCAESARLCPPQHEVDPGRQPLPFFDFGLELLAARLRQRIEASAAVVLRRAPLGRDPALLDPQLVV